MIMVNNATIRRPIGIIMHSTPSTPRVPQRAIPFIGVKGNVDNTLKSG